MSTRPGSSSSCFITSHCFDSSTMSRTIAYRADAKRPLPVLPCPLPISQPLLGIPSQTSLITPPISPNSQPFDLPPSSGVMADLAVRSTDSPSLGADDATAFQAHLLALLSVISQHPPPSFPFPTNPDSLQPNPDTLTFSPYPGDMSRAQDAIEKAVIALGQRVWDAERTTPSLSKENKLKAKSHTDLLTPEWTPPANDPEPPLPAICPICTRALSDSSTPTNSIPTSFPSPSSHPLSLSLSTPPGQLSAMRPIASNVLNPIPHNILTTSNGASVLTGGPRAAGWSVRGSVGESGMSAEKELELLKAQVQDIARVCKVRRPCWISRPQKLMFTRRWQRATLRRRSSFQSKGRP